MSAFTVAFIANANTREQIDEQPSIPQANYLKNYF
jgi:hypothetical protein